MPATVKKSLTFNSCVFWNFTCGVYIEAFSHTFNDQLQRDKEMQVYYNENHFQ